MKRRNFAMRLRLPASVLLPNALTATMSVEAPCFAAVAAARSAAGPSPTTMMSHASMYPTSGIYPEARLVHKVRALAGWNLAGILRLWYAAQQQTESHCRPYIHAEKVGIGNSPLRRACSNFRVLILPWLPPLRRTSVRTT